MTDFHTLTDAFDALERRADAASARAQTEPTMRTTGRPRPRPDLMPMAAAVVAVLAVATAAALLTRGGGSSTVAGAPPAASHIATARPHDATPTARPTTFQIPETPAELARRFRTVLGETATFTVTDTGTPVQPTVPSRTDEPTSPVTPGAPRSPVTPLPASPPKTNGAAIVGTLTAAGITGGFDLQIFRDSPGATARCDDPDRSTCTVRRLADGSSLAVGSEPLQGSPNGVTYQVSLIRRDGVEFLMHLSNERDPKGQSTVLAAHPPLTTEQMTALVTSNRW